MNLSVAVLAKSFGTTESKMVVWRPHVLTAMAMYGINQTNEIASFVAQCAHESMYLKRLEENLNYSAEGLANTWPGRFRDARLKPNVLAQSLARKPEKIANFVYANRMGNGNEQSGDGWKYKGRGFIMITGKSNYSACGKALGVDLVIKPDYLLMPEYACKSAAWFWHVNGLDAHDDDFSVLAETKKINGGTIGLADRQRLFNKALEALNAA